MSDQQLRALGAIFALGKCVGHVTDATHAIQHIRYLIRQHQLPVNDEVQQTLEELVSLGGTLATISIALSRLAETYRNALDSAPAGGEEA